MFRDLGVVGLIKVSGLRVAGPFWGVEMTLWGTELAGEEISAARATAQADFRRGLGKRPGCALGASDLPKFEVQSLHRSVHEKMVCAASVHRALDRPLGRP